MEYDPVDTWINSVCASHSNSIRTRQGYLLIFQGYSKFICMTGQEIILDYEKSTDRQFRRKHALYIKNYTSWQLSEGNAPSTISSRVGVLKSFYKYNDLPIGFVPAVKARMLYHNRDITHKEIKLILDASRPREKAFYTIMAQSGLRPYTLCNLKYENIKEDFEKKRIPCKIEIPQEIAKGKYHSYFTFIGAEAVKYLQSYLIIRKSIRDEDYIFLSDDGQKQLNPKSISKFFAQTVKKLNEKDLMNVKQKKETKPHDIRLYNLRKFFRKYANQAGFEFVQFWMGHTVNAGQDKHYRPKDEEYHRKLYAENAMPHLRIETTTPTETDKAIITLEQENRELKEQIGKLEIMMEKIYNEVFREKVQSKEYKKMLELAPEYVELCERTIYDREERIRKEGEYLTENPEALKMREEQNREEEEYIKNSPSITKKLDEMIQEQVIRLDERKKTLMELRNKSIEAKKTKK